VRFPDRRKIRRRLDPQAADAPKAVDIVRQFQ
jgi:hypothetical protein